MGGAKKQQIQVLDHTIKQTTLLENHKKQDQRLVARVCHIFLHLTSFNAAVAAFEETKDSEKNATQSQFHSLQTLQKESGKVQFFSCLHCLSRSD